MILKVGRVRSCGRTRCSYGKRRESEPTERYTVVKRLGCGRGRGELRGIDRVPRDSPCLLSLGRGVGTSLKCESPRQQDQAALEQIIGRVRSVISRMAPLNAPCAGVRYYRVGGRSLSISSHPQVVEMRGDEAICELCIALTCRQRQCRSMEGMHCRTGVW